MRFLKGNSIWCWGQDVIVLQLLTVEKIKIADHGTLSGAIHLQVPTETISRPALEANVMIHPKNFLFSSRDNEKGFSGKHSFTGSGVGRVHTRSSDTKETRNSALSQTSVEGNSYISPTELWGLQVLCIWICWKPVKVERSAIGLTSHVPMSEPPTLGPCVTQGARLTWELSARAASSTSTCILPWTPKAP